MKIEVGKYYKSKEGHKVKIIWDDRVESVNNGTSFPLAGMDTTTNWVEWYEEDGRNARNDDDRNLVSEHREPREVYVAFHDSGMPAHVWRGHEGLAANNQKYAKFKEVLE